MANSSLQGIPRFEPEISASVVVILCSRLINKIIKQPELPTGSRISLYIVVEIPTVVEKGGVLKMRE
jgi:hypothetical protein